MAEDVNIISSNDKKNDDNENDKEIQDKDIKLSLKTVKIKTIRKYLPIILLFAFLIFGFYLRAYHIDYPVVGYHNWKETHYLTDTRNFVKDGFFAHGFFVSAHDYPNLNEDPSGAHAEIFSTASVFLSILFRIFGESLFTARLFMILLSLGSTIFFYLLVKELFKNEELALLTTFLSVLAPLFVFFGRNVDVVNPGLFFMLMSAYFYVVWVKNFNGSSDDGHSGKHADKNADEINEINEFKSSQQAKNNQQLINLNDWKSYWSFCIFALSLLMAFLSKYTFIVIAIPMAAIFPYKKMYYFIIGLFRQKQFFKDKNKWKRISPYLISMFLFILFPLQYLGTRIISEKTATAAVTTKLIDFSVLFNPNFMVMMKSYISDNYTLLGIFVALLGFLVFLISIKKNFNKISFRFMLAYALGSMLFFVIMSKKLFGHSYHQYPIAPVIIFFMAYFIYVSSLFVVSITTGIINKKYAFLNYLKYVVILLFVLLLYPSSIAAIDRQFDFQMIGLDVAGEYIKQHSLPDERIFFSGGQTFGVLWHADRKGYDRHSIVDELKYGEENLNFKWIFVYQWGFNEINNPEVREYISNNYGLQQIAFEQSGNQQKPIYIILKKGGTFDINKINEYIADKPVEEKAYELTNRERKLLYVNVIP